MKLKTELTFCLFYSGLTVAACGQMLADFFILALASSHPPPAHLPDILTPSADKCRGKHVNVPTDIEMASFIDYSLDPAF